MKGSVVGKYFAVVLLSAVCAAGSVALGQNSGPILFWNLENYFDPFDDSLTRDEEFTPKGRRHWSWKRFESKRNFIAKVLISIKDIAGGFPVVAGFSEVENRMVLEQLVTNTPLVKLGYKVIHRDSPDRRGIDVAMIYREEFFTPLGVQSIGVHLPDSASTRDILQVEGILKSANQRADTVVLFVVHFPSKISGAKHSSSRREIAAKTLREAINNIQGRNFPECLLKSGSMPQRTIIVMGDFNDTPDSEVFDLFREDFRILGEQFLSGGGTDANLYGNFKKEVEQGNLEVVSGSIKYRGVWELIDNFMVSGPDWEKWKFGIFGARMLLEVDFQYLGLKPRRTFIGPSYNAGVSDHLPVFIML